MDKALTGPRNPSGSNFHFSKIDEIPQDQGHLLRYRILIPNMTGPPSQVYRLSIWRIGSEIKVLRKQVYLNARGLLMKHLPLPDQQESESLGAEDEVEVEFVAAHGEPVRFTLVSSDERIEIPGTIVPYPIEGKDANCGIQARLGFPEGERILVFGAGFRGNTPVPVYVVSEGKSHAVQVTANELGGFVTIVDPHVEGSDSGVVKISVDPRECPVAVEIPWGSGTYQPI